MENRSYLKKRKCSEKEAVFRNVLEKAVRKKKTKVFFKHALVRKDDTCTVY